MDLQIWKADIDDVIANVMQQLLGTWIGILLTIAAGIAVVALVFYYSYQAYGVYRDGKKLAKKLRAASLQYSIDNGIGNVSDSNSVGNTTKTI